MNNTMYLEHKINASSEAFMALRKHVINAAIFNGKIFAYKGYGSENYKINCIYSVYDPIVIVDIYVNGELARINFLSQEEARENLRLRLKTNNFWKDENFSPEKYRLD